MSINYQASAASALLSAPVLRSVIKDGANSKLANFTISRLLETGLGYGAATVRTLIWRCDRWLSRNYRNDLVYRKAILNQIMSGNRVLLPEFRANRSVADILAVSDMLHAVEIKSDLDNVSRLGNQLRDYMQIAPLVSVLATQRVAENVASNAQFDSVGLYWLNSEGEAETLREARFCGEHLNSGVMMRSLRRNEYTAVLESMGTPLPELPNTRIFSSALGLSLEADPLMYHNAVVEQLRRRRPQAGRSSISRLPEPVRPAILKLDPTKQQISSLQAWFDQEVTDVYA